MMNKERTRAPVRIVEEEEPQPQQPVEGILSAFLQAYLYSMPQKIPEDTRQLETLLNKKGFVQC